MENRPTAAGPDARIAIDDCLVPWSVFRNQPVFLTSPEGGVVLLPVFTSRAKLWGAMDWARPQEAVTIKRVEDETDLAIPLPPNTRIALNPHVVDGNTRWFEIPVGEEVP